jgi:hypothetical protein
MRARFAIALVPFLLLPAACGGAELEFADWIPPLPRQGVEFFEYAGVPYDERAGHRIELVEDLVLGDSTNPQEAFYRPAGVVSDDQGNIFVLDSGDRRIQAFDESGAYLRTMGREGQGPGELARPSSLTVSAEHLTLRADTRRLSVWTLGGEHLRDVNLGESLLSSIGFEGGFVARSSSRPASDSTGQLAGRTLTYAAYGPFGEQLRRFVDIEEPLPTRIDLGGQRFLSTPGGLISDWGVRFAVAGDGSFYVTTSREYQLHAYSERPWSLRVAWPREAVTREHRDIVSTRYREEPFGNVDLSGVAWTDRFRAIYSLEVDGHGHIYVFPFHLPLNSPIAEGEERPDIPRPVDVYAPTGELLFNGTIELPGWGSARGDFVYTTRTDEDTNEIEVVRYRLVEPF